MSKQVELGNSGMIIYPVGLGCMGFSHAYGAPTEKNEAVNSIRAAFDMGYNFFDTAECYTGINADGSTSYNEELVGEALHDVRDNVIIATKCGVQHSPTGLLTDSRPETIRRSVEGSLKRLNTDCIDLYYQHRIDPKVPAEDVAGVMGDLIQEGKIRAWGISETDEAYLRRAHAVTPVTAIQNRYSMMARDWECLFPVLEEMEITFVAFSPLANGILSDAYKKGDTFDATTDYRSHMPQYKPEAFDANRDLFDYIRELAQEKGATPAQISLAWMVCKQHSIVPIPGSRKLERMKENHGAGAITLSEEEVQAIDAKLDTLNMSGMYGKKQ